MLLIIPAPNIPFFPCIIAQFFCVALSPYANWLLSYLPLLSPHSTCLSLWTGCDFNFELCLSNFLLTKHCTTGSSFVSVQVCVCPSTLAATALCCFVSVDTHILLWTDWFLSGSLHLGLGLPVHFLVELCSLLKQLLPTNVLSSQASQTNILPSWGPKRNQATTS